ncbi:MAG TPA: FKBP-type peptidyl-prolyl cis-trans isomerase [Salinivirga sp.]|uniref:FKBP-type peptidyl-prolyl cis-trans isomerase n=1 Tax=Salinivirga sp. TaxID=1970192 RepID=UPI002B49CA2E|nr:FKBP-type peptidyl-prolyl cis-trans isomerase [Salinivirga sp.]HKK58679.1 FKBP-type peptidyl-prolyl cis-trans isomerase [Salinivirga sp.]
MKSIINALVIVALTTLMMACGGKSKEFQTHEKGFDYLFIDRSEVGLSPRNGDIVTLRISIKAPNDSVLKRANMFRVQVEKSKYKGGINDALKFMHEGDSMAFLIDALDYYRFDEEQNVPEFLKKGDKLRFDIRLADIKDLDQVERERQLNQISGRKRELIALKHFAKGLGIQDSVHLNRYFVKTIEQGNGVSPTPGDKVSVDYLGYFVDGSPFDNSYERGEPFTFTIGSNQVIEGLEKGVQEMKVGGKATILIPSPLAYGEEGLPRANIAPFTTLVFDVELQKVN